MIFSNEHAIRNYNVYTEQITKLLLYIVLQIRWQVYTFLTAKRYYTSSFPVTYLLIPLTPFNIKFIPRLHFSQNSPFLHSRFFSIKFSPILKYFDPISIFSPSCISSKASYLIFHIYIYACSNIYPKIKENRIEETSRGIFKIAAGSGLDNSIVNRSAGVIIRIKLTPASQEARNIATREFLSLIGIHPFSRNACDFNMPATFDQPLYILVSLTRSRVRAYQPGLSTRY